MTGLGVFLIYFVVYYLAFAIVGSAVFFLAVWWHSRCRRRGSPPSQS